MKPHLRVPAGRMPAILASALLALALSAQPVAASNASIFKSTRAYVGKSSVHQNAFDDKYTARDYAGASTEVARIARNAVAARAALRKQWPSNARGAKGKTALLQYWSLKHAAAAELALAVAASASGDKAAKKRHLARYEILADKAVGLLFVAIRYLQ
jgi:hypothetical protein